MITSDERRKLIERYSQPVDVRAALAAAAAGLLIVMLVAAFGGSFAETDPADAAAISSKQLATGR
jgi:hypothetical protein